MTDKREEARRRAQDFLRAPNGDPAELQELSKTLIDLDEMGYARRLLARAREQKITDATQRKDIARKHALSTYKDPDLPVHDKLVRALEILEETFDLKTTDDQEVLGLAGAIHKRMWQVDTDKQHLERGFEFYNRGFNVGVTQDYGYTAINAAYVLDLIASIEEQDASDVGVGSATAPGRRDEARITREAIVRDVAPLVNTNANLNEDWWFLVTVAEAYFGLGNLAEARSWLTKAKNTDRSAWKLQSTAEQLVSLAKYQSGTPSDLAEFEQTEEWSLLREFLDDKADALRTIFSGKFGLALSGGGFRASYFHIGVLAKLAELDLLRHVHVLSCVSGGSIVGAHYYLELQKILEGTADTDVGRQEYIDLVERLFTDFHTGVKRNIRVRVGTNLLLNLRMAFSSSYSRTARIGELYEKELYGNPEIFINDLRIFPLGVSDFNPRIHNWERQNKVPMLVLNATTLNTGHNWQFTASYMGESPYSIDNEVDGNWRYRRMYYGEAPDKYKRVRLGLAVGASACVPGLFEPIAMHGLYPDQESQHPDMTVRLVDGGVHDNQGVTSLLEQDCTSIFVSDASGQMTSQAAPKAGVIGPLLRSNSSLMERVRQAQYADLKARERSGLIRNLAVAHLKKGLEVDPVSWKWCREPTDTPLRRRTKYVEYGVLRNLQEKLANIRTDLDSFNDVEAHALVADGYLMAEKYAPGLTGFRQVAASRHDWPFLDIEDVLRGRANQETEIKVTELLTVGSNRFFKVWRLSILLRIAAIVLGLAAAGAFTYLWFEDPYSVLLKVTLNDVGWVLFWIALTLLLGKTIVSVIRYQSTLSKVLQGVAMAFVGWIGSHVHLLIFDKWFLKKGSADKLK